MSRRRRDADPGTCFHWQDGDRPLWRLLTRLLLTLAGAAAFFLLFQVVYPLSRPTAIIPQSILVLSPADAQARSILSRVRDESPLLLNRAVAAPALPAMQPSYQPSFAGREMRLQSPPQSRAARPMPRLFTISEAPLPPLPEVKRPASPAADRPPPRRLAPAFHGELASRPLAAPPRLDGIAPADAQQIRFRISADASGRVVFALPLAASDDRTAMQRLRQALGAMRFAPAATPAQWGDITFLWEQPQP